METNCHLCDHSGECSEEDDFEQGGRTQKSWKIKPGSRPTKCLSRKRNNRIYQDLS